jgi:hypothetical protein
MVKAMRLALLTTVLALTAFGATSPAAAGATTKNPTKAQVRTAVRRAEGSRSLWATVNVCNSRRYPDTLGIRAEMPTLGFPAWLSIHIQLYYYDQQNKQFVAVTSGGYKLVELGQKSTGLQQAGYLFSFKPQAGLLNATVQFIWRRSGKVLGRISRPTTDGHPTADFGSPPHYSAEQCRIP